MTDMMAQGGHKAAHQIKSAMSSTSSVNEIKQAFSDGKEELHNGVTSCGEAFKSTIDGAEAKATREFKGAAKEAQQDVASKFDTFVKALMAEMMGKMTKTFDATERKSCERFQTTIQDVTTASSNSIKTELTTSSDMLCKKVVKELEPRWIRNLQRAIGLPPATNLVAQLVAMKHHIDQHLPQNKSSLYKLVEETLKNAEHAHVLHFLFNRFIGFEQHEDDDEPITLKSSLGVLGDKLDAIQKTSETHHQEFTNSHDTFERIVKR